MNNKIKNINQLNSSQTDISKGFNFWKLFSLRWKNKKQL